MVFNVCLLCSLQSPVASKFIRMRQSTKRHYVVCTIELKYIPYLVSKIESLKALFFLILQTCVPFFLDAKNLWNNLLEPKGAKSFWKRYSSLQCPTSERPFFSTKNNSDDFDQYYDEDSSGHFQQIIRSFGTRLSCLTNAISTI